MSVRSAWSGSGGGTPEQVHLTWGEDPATTVVVSWVSPGRARRPRVRIGQRVIGAAERRCTDRASGQRVWTYHARVDGLRPGATYGYAVTADNDRGAADPFSATFTTAPGGRARFRFTSFGDLAGPDPARPAPGDSQAAAAVGAVESFQPLFHLLNADPAGRGLGHANQASAAHRPWMPVPGDHPADGYALPSNGCPEFEGRWYSFRVGSALFVSLSADDVARAAPYARGYSGRAQTRWLAGVLARAREDPAIDWIIAQTHRCACSSSPAGHDSDAGIRAEWLPLFDAYQVDLVVSGHGPGYQRSPRPVTTTDSGVFDTSQGTVHLVLGGGIAVFDLDPGTEAGGQTSITVTYYHEYTEFETFTLVRPVASKA